MIEVLMHQLIEHHEHEQSSNVGDQQARRECVVGDKHQGAFEQRKEWKEGRFGGFGVAKGSNCHIMAGIPVMTRLPEPIDRHIAPGKIAHRKKRRQTGYHKKGDVYRDIRWQNVPECSIPAWQECGWLYLTIVCFFRAV